MNLKFLLNGSLSIYLILLYHLFGETFRILGFYHCENHLRKLICLLIEFDLFLTLYHLLAFPSRITNNHQANQNLCNQNHHLVFMDYRYKLYRIHETNRVPNFLRKQADLLNKIIFPIHAFDSFSINHHNSLHPDRKIFLYHVEVHFS